MKILQKILHLLKMKKSEKDLLNHLQENQIQSSPLSNVRQGLGELSNIQGNPLFSAEISINVTKSYFQDFGGGAWANIAPAAVPAVLQIPLPFVLFGLTDFYSGYPSFLRQYQIGGWFFQLALIQNTLVPPAGIPVVTQLGDLMVWYMDATNTFACFYVINCASIAYGTFLNSFVSDLVTVSNIRLNVNIADINQFTNTLLFSYQTLFGKLFTDNVDPRMYITNKDFQQQICDIPINFPIDKNLMISSYMDFNILNETFTFFVSKVEALTLRKKYLNR